MGTKKFRPKITELDKITVNNGDIFEVLEVFDFRFYISDEMKHYLTTDLKDEFVSLYVDTFKDEFIKKFLNED